MWSAIFHSRNKYQHLISVIYCLEAIINGGPVLVRCNTKEQWPLIFPGSELITIYIFSIVRSVSEHLSAKTDIHLAWEKNPAVSMNQTWSNYICCNRKQGKRFFQSICIYNFFGHTPSTGNHQSTNTGNEWENGNSNVYIVHTNVVTVNFRQDNEIPTIDTKINIVWPNIEGAILSSPCMLIQKDVG
jgi:hypothetical protein